MPLICFVILPLIALPFATVAIFREHRSLRKVCGPDRCSKCGYIVDGHTLSRGRCPECGVDFGVYAVSTQQTRMAAIDARVGPYFATSVIGLLAGLLVAVYMIANLQTQKGWTATLVVMLTVGGVVTAAGSAAVMWGRAKVRRQINHEQK